MTVPLSSGSPRGAAARRFGAELDRAMRTRGIGSKWLGAQTGTAISAIGNWRAGLNLPRLATAIRMAEALDCPKLVELVREARRGRCPVCKREWINEGGKPKTFCSQACRSIDEQLRRPTAGAGLAAAIRGELARRRREVSGGQETNAILEAALRTYNAGESKARVRRDQALAALTDHQAAIEDYCRGCEPDGRCKTVDCPLRPVSPLPLVRVGEREVSVVQPAPGAWGAENRDHMLQVIRAANAERWSRPGERERASATMLDRFAGMTDDERAEHGRRISEGIDPAKRSAASTRVHAERRARREAVS